MKLYKYLTSLVFLIITGGILGGIYGLSSFQGLSHGYGWLTLFVLIYNFIKFLFTDLIFSMLIGCLAGLSLWVLISVLLRFAVRGKSNEQ